MIPHIDTLSAWNIPTTPTTKWFSLAKEKRAAPTPRIPSTTASVYLPSRT